MFERINIDGIIVNNFMRLLLFVILLNFFYSSNNILADLNVFPAFIDKKYNPEDTFSP